MPPDIGIALMQYFCLLFSLCVHEAAHAGMAHWCGDDTARLQGRLTLDPRKHIDPLGTVILPLLMIFTRVPLLFGWAKPVPFNPRNLGNIRRDPYLIAFAGPVSNIIIAITCAVFLRIMLLLVSNEIVIPAMDVLMKIVGYMIFINVILAIFNMIPLPPLDGRYILYFFLPESSREFLERYGPFFIIFAILFVATPWIAAILPPAMRILLAIASYGVMPLGEVLDLIGL